MREFSWTNSDVIEWLQELKDKLVSLTEVMQFFKDEFNVTKGKRAIYNHMPETTSEEVFIDKDEVLSLHSKYGNELKAIKEGDKFRVYTMKIRGIYECIDCKHVSQDERPVPLPLLFEKRGRYKLNKGVHHSICFLWTRNEDDTANAKHDQSILPGTFKFLSAASNFLATAEKKEQRVSAKKKFKAVKRWVALQTRKSEQRKKSADVIMKHSPVGMFQVYAFNTNFFNKLRRNAASAMRWTMKVDLQSFDIILVPIHLPGHWALSIMDMRKKGMYYFDSMLGDGGDCLRELREFLVLESVAKRGKALNTMDWTFLSVKMNGSDCGVFLCRFAECIARDADTDFKAADMNEFRKKIVQGIKSGKLI
uniref:Ubiquitin-like protease family profile domain-containing protein n=1 Tax=Ditylenchus dipsaci TaxID=166011 RepID=A0A915DCY3_9BILA